MLEGRNSSAWEVLLKEEKIIEKMREDGSFRISASSKLTWFC